MEDFERACAKEAAAVEGSPASVARSAAIVMIDQGNALEEQGQFAEAMARYDAAAQADPDCARAHLNRGNILFAGARIDEAREAYQRAIACDPQYASAHFNLGNVNSRIGEFERALDDYRAAIAIRPDFADAFVAMANALDSLGRTREAIESYECALAINPDFAEIHFNLGVAQFNLGRNTHAAESFRAALAIDATLADAHSGLADTLLRLGDSGGAIACYRRVLEISPPSAQTLYKLGSVLRGAGRLDEAVESLREAAHLQPQLFEAHYSMGITLMSMRPNPPLEMAASSLRRAAQIRPDFAPAHHNLGFVLSSLNQLDAAEESLRRALSIEPGSARILYDLAILLLARGRSLEALHLTLRGLESAPAWSTKSAFASCIAHTKLTADDPRIRAALAAAISEPWGTPYELCRPAIHMIMLNRPIAGCVRRANTSWPARLPKAELFGADGLAVLAADCLLQTLLETTPVTTVEFERFLTGARHALLEAASNMQAPDPSDLAALGFYAAVARQCFINEYIFACDENERLAASASRTKLLGLLDADAMVPPLLLLAVAAYFPLHSLHEPRRLLAADRQGPVGETLRQQIREPLEEQALRAGIERLTAISAGVSEDVRSQYEQNPYPCWVKLPARDQALRFNDELRRTLPFVSFTPLQDDSAPQALIAGCGTGGQSILFAQRFRGVRVLAIDLSLSSISYAKRKTQEMGLTNIEYAQADILRLGEIDRTFDIIESVGVLHHLADPLAGWRTLLSRLRPGGFMGLGFYSELARRRVVKTREWIAARGYASTPDDIRRFRQDLAVESAGAGLLRLWEAPDFYSTSECRDLLFHVQEHRLSIEQIDSFLSENGLDFIGFELNTAVLLQYRARFADDPLGANLRNWARFEADNPDTFIGMYRFWIQKPPIV